MLLSSVLYSLFLCKFWINPQGWWTGSTWYTGRAAAATVAANGGVSTLGFKLGIVFDVDGILSQPPLLCYCMISLHSVPLN